MMLSRTGSFAGLCRSELCYYSSAPSTKLHGLHYPSGSGGRYRAQHQVGQMSPVQVNQVLKVRRVQHLGLNVSDVSSLLVCNIYCTQVQLLN